jgi:Uma2 family endonuclease
MSAIAITPAPEPRIETLADLLKELGEVPSSRIRWHPFPGTARDQDVIHELDRHNRPCELVDGVLIQKAMGFYESRLASVLIGLLERYLEEHPLGIVAGEAGTLKLKTGLVRIPDVSFVSWDRLPGREIPAEPLPRLTPDLAVEVLSEGITAGEMDRKLREYFASGVRLVWYFEPKIPRLRIYTSLEDCRELGEDGVIDGGDVLPGFRLSIREWLQRAGKRRQR